MRLSTYLYARVTAIGCLALAVAVMVGAMAWPEGSQAQSNEMLIRAVAPETAKKGDEGIVVQINAENADNIASFQFDLKFDSDVLEVATNEADGMPLVQRGEFLGSTGREVVCDDPESQSGVVRFVCISLRLEPEGPDGAGTLATVSFNAIGAGSTELTLDNVVANEPDATRIPLQVQGGAITVTGGGGTNWLLWIGGGAAVMLVVLAAGLFLASRYRGKLIAP